MLFSVVLPAYNKGDTICQALHSVFEQRQKDFEIIVVNDGSTDSTREKLKDFGSLRVIHQENQGVSVARNNGILAARGEYICFLDADDLWYPEHLSVLTELISRYPQTGFFCTSHAVSMCDGSYKHSAERLQGYPDSFITGNLFALLNRLSDGIIHTNSICVRRELLMSQGLFFEPGERIGEDTDLWYRIALRNEMVLSRRETTLYRRENSTATKAGSNCYTWRFAARKDDIESSDASPEVKRECRLLFDRYIMQCSRDYMLDRQRGQAKTLLRSVTVRNRTYYLTQLYCALPYVLCAAIRTAMSRRCQS